MACDMREETLIDFLAGELSEGEAVGLEQHLAECRECRVAITALARVSHPFLSEESWQPDAAMVDRILRDARTEGWATEASPRSPIAVPRPIPRRAFFSWVARPLPSYAAVGIAGVALGVGLLVGGGVGPRAERAVPTGVEGSGAPLRPTLRSVDRSPERLAGRLSEADSLPASASPIHPDHSSIGARRAPRPLAFVAVYTDAIRLTTPGRDDSL